MTSTSTREKIVTGVEKLLMTLGKIWTQFVLEKKYVLNRANISGVRKSMLLFVLFMYAMNQ